MGRVQFAFNCIAIAGAAIHILAGIIAVYYLIPKASVAHEEILSRKSRSLDSQEVIQNSQEILKIEDRLENQTSSDANCYSADTCSQCVSLSRDCIWYDTTKKSGCYIIEAQSLFTLGKALSVVYEEGVDNVSWGSCEVPLAVLCFAAISIAVISVVVIAFVVVHCICKPSKEEQMLLEVNQAVKKEKLLKRLGRLNPLPSNNQDLCNNIKV